MLGQSYLFVIDPQFRLFFKKMIKKSLDLDGPFVRRFSQYVERSFCLDESDAFVLPGLVNCYITMENHYF